MVLEVYKTANTELLKLAFVKLVKEATGWGLKEAKDVLDSICLHGRRHKFEIMPQVSALHFIAEAKTLGFYVRADRKTRIAKFLEDSTKDVMLKAYLSETKKCSEESLEYIETEDKGCEITVNTMVEKYDIMLIDLLAWVYSKNTVATKGV
jgi:hypothetical protein